MIGAAGGNPLFVEELLALTLEDPSLEIPSTLDLLLAARLERLSRDERSAAERASVEGEVFHRGAVVELSEPRARLTVPAALARLADHGLLRTTPPSFANEAAYKFRHILIRDAAYRATLKKLRAELHERFAGWLEGIAGDRVTEFEEILGFHLEQAYRYREDLGATAPYRDLAERAAKWLGSAGTRAAGRGDAGAAIKLLERTLALLPKRRARQARAVTRAGGITLGRARPHGRKGVRVVGRGGRFGRTKGHRGVREALARVCRHPPEPGKRHGRPSPRGRGVAAGRRGARGRPSAREGMVRARHPGVRSAPLRR